MAKVISIDPGMYKCGFILADIKQKNPESRSNPEKLPSNTVKKFQ